MSRNVSKVGRRGYAPGESPCANQWHYGTLAATNHWLGTEAGMGWTGIHGAPTRNPSGYCDQCKAEILADYGTVIED
jgi:hypothetical protein